MTDEQWHQAEWRPESQARALTSVHPRPALTLFGDSRIANLTLSVTTDTR